MTRGEKDADETEAQTSEGRGESHPAGHQDSARYLASRRTGSVPLATRREIVEGAPRLTLRCDNPDCGARSGPEFNVGIGEECFLCRRGFMRLVPDV